MGPPDLTTRRYSAIALVLVILLGLSWVIDRVPLAASLQQFVNPAAGLVVAVLFLFGWRVLAAICIAQIAAVVVMGGRPSIEAVISTGLAAASYALCAWPLGKVIRRDFTLRQGRAGVAAVVAISVVAPVAAAAALWLLHQSLGWPVSQPPREVLANLLGALTVAPVLLSEAALPLGMPVSADDRVRPDWWAHGVAALAVILVVAVDLHPATADFRTSFLILIPSVWLATNRGVRGAAVGNLVTTAVFGLGALLAGNPANYREADQVFLIGLCLATLTLAVLTESRFAAERRAAQHERRYRLLADHASDLVTIQTAGGGIEYVSPSVQSQLAFDPAELIGRPMDDLVHPDDLAATRSERAAPFSQGEVRQIINRVRRRDGTYRWMEHALRQMPEPDAGGTIRWIVTSRDISARRTLEDTLHQSQRLESVGRLAGGVAHDFNNLLTAILGQASLIEDEDAVAPEVKTQVVEIRKAAERAAGLTNQLLAFARRQVSAPRSVDLNELAQGMDRLLRRVLGEDVRLTTTLEPEVWTVRVDPGQFEQVLVNLAVNARDAMPNGGELAVTTRNRVIPAGRSPHPALSSGDYVEVTVRDTGHGMAPEELARIFEPFFTTKPVGKGTGLGLAVCHGIVQQSGGQIVVESAVGKGTTFRILLPRQRRHEEPADHEALPLTRASRGETVLIVEDDALVRNLAAQVLRRAGYVVLEAGDGASAAALAGGADPAPAVLIADVVMPDISGIALAKSLGSEIPELKILYVSGFPERITDTGGPDDAAPVHDFLMKPFSPKELLRRVQMLLDRPARPTPALPTADRAS